MRLCFIYERMEKLWCHTISVIFGVHIRNLEFYLHLMMLQFVVENFYSILFRLKCVALSCAIPTRVCAHIVHLSNINFIKFWALFAELFSVSHNHLRKNMSRTMNDCRNGYGIEIKYWTVKFSKLNNFLSLHSSSSFETKSNSQFQVLFELVQWMMEVMWGFIKYHHLIVLFKSVKVKKGWKFN